MCSCLCTVLPVSVLYFKKKHWNRLRENSSFRYFVTYQITFLLTYNTVGINPRLSDLKGPGTSKLDWRYLEYNKIDRNELQIRTNSQKGTGTKIAEKLNNFEKFERKKVKFQPCS